MRAVKAKATRRELKRAFGSDATETVGMIGEAVNNQGKVIHGLISEGGVLDQRAEEFRAIGDELEAFRGMGLVDRFYWLLRGRR